MNLPQVALQLYTLRDFCRNSADFAATLRRVRAIGYEAVQLSGIGPIADAEIVSIVQGEGITICATHEPSETILNEPARVVERLERLGCRYTAYPFPSGIDFAEVAQLDSLIARLDAAGAILRKAGQVLSYHNHAHEFFKVNGRPLLELIYERTDPLHLMAELDTFWIQAGGGNPVDWCARLEDRMVCIHLKDYAVNAAGERYFAEIGQGNLDFKAIIAAAEASGCEWFIVEQDTCPRDPFESIRMSYEFIKNNLIEPEA